MSLVELDQNGAALRLSTTDGNWRFHGIWLRDNALDPATRDPGNGQRLITLADLPEDCSLAGARIEGDKVFVTFNADGKEVAFDLGWLVDHAYDTPQNRTPGQLPQGAVAWDSSLSDQVPSGDLNALQSCKDALRAWLTALRKYGFAKVTGVPCEEGSLFQIVDLFGYVRETNYGRLFEVRTEVNPVNLAYTGLGLVVSIPSLNVTPLMTLAR